MDIGSLLTINTKSVLTMLVPLASAAKIGPIEFQKQQAIPIKSLAFSPVDGRPHPVSGSKGRWPLDSGM